MGEAARPGVVAHLAEQLREDVLSGALPPGTPLREPALAERFGVARSSVREAVRDLVADGLARHELHRGVAVAAPTADDLADVHVARVAIESAAADVVPHAPDVSALDDTLAAMRRAVEAGDHRAAAEADLAFHAALVALVGSRHLDAAYDQLQGELRLAVLRADRTAPEADKVARHAHLRDLVVAGDEKALRAAVRAHADAAFAALVEALRP